MVKRDTILIVDDQELNRVILRNIFEDEYNLLEAENGEQALTLAASYHERIAVVLLDLVMPVKDGYEVLKELDEKTLLGSFPVIVITAEDSAENEVKAFDLGASDIIMKPFEPYVVHRRVQNVVELNLRKLNQQEIIDAQAEKLRESNSTMIDALSSIIEYRSVETGQHIHRIRLFTEALLTDVAGRYPEYGLDSTKIAMIASASSMHDIGKIAIPDSILNKPGRLTDEEYAIMKTHTTKGCEMLASLDRMSDREYLSYAYNICRHHHERWDGRGYPDGLKGGEIPLCAQVVGIADCYDALTSDRVYKKALSPEQAYNMILNGECGAFSPDLLESFKEVRAEFEKLSAAYSDNQPQPKKLYPERPERKETPDKRPQTARHRYFALLQYMDRTVVELDCTEGYYHVVYLSDPLFAPLKTEDRFETAYSRFVRAAVTPEDQHGLTEALTKKIEAFFHNGLLRFERSFRIRRDGVDIPCEETWLRVDAQNTHQKRALLVWRIGTVLSAGSDNAPEISAKAQLLPSDGGRREEFDTLGGLALLHYDQWLTIVHVSPWFSTVLGYTPQELTEQSRGQLARLVFPEDVRHVRKLLTAQLKKGKTAKCEFRMVRKDGSRVWVHAKGALILDSDGESYLQCMVMDVSHMAAARDELEKILKRHEIIMDQSNDIIFEWDAAGDHMTYSSNWEKKYGYRPVSGHFCEALPQKSHIHPQDIPAIREMMRALKEGPVYREQIFRLADNDGRYRWSKARATSLADEQGCVYKVVGLLMDIDAERRAVAVLEEEAQRDGLTRLYNKNAGRHKIEAILADMDPEELGAMLIIDMDNFKQINDSYGHLFGDSVLRAFAGELGKLFRAGDILSRIGGDEFLVFMGHIPSPKVAQERAGFIIDACHRIFSENQVAFDPSCSIGIALAGQDGHTYETLFKKSDMALYLAKSMGKNIFAMYQERDGKGPVQGFTPGHSASTMIESFESPKDTLFKLVTKAADVLYRSPDIDQGIRDVLAAVGQTLDVSRGYIFEESPDGSFVTNTYEWCGRGITSKMDDFADYPYEQFGGRDNYIRLFDENGIFVCPDVDQLPEYYRRLLGDGKIKAVFQCALLDGSHFRGFIGFDDCRILRLWNPEQIESVGTIAKILSACLTQRTYNKANDKMKKGETV